VFHFTIVFIADMTRLKNLGMNWLHPRFTTSAFLFLTLVYKFMQKSALIAEIETKVTRAVTFYSRRNSLLFRRLYMP